MIQPQFVLVGIGWSWMSWLAWLLLELWYTQIVWIDATESVVTKKLEKQWVRIILGHGNYTVQPTDFVIYSQAAVQSVEVETARHHAQENHITAVYPMLYAQFLWELSKYCRTIAVTGTHGKSSTSSMLAHTMSQHDPRMGIGIIGATLPDWNNKWYFCNPNATNDLKALVDQIVSRKAPLQEWLYKHYTLVVEADEYNKHFLHLDVDYAIITTCDGDHLDTYGSEEHYYETFFLFAQRVKNTLYIPANHDAWITAITTYLTTQASFSPIIKTIPTQQFSFAYLLWWHNHTNASLAYAVLNDLLDQPANLQTSIELFRGIGRRAEHLGTNAHNIPVISDYWHHPVEIASTLSALQEHYPDTHITVIFEPHQLTRVVEFYDAFKTALATAQRVYLFSIYHAREDYTTIQQKYSNHPIQYAWSLTTFTQQTAQYRNAFPLNASDLSETLHSIDQGIIVLFTAWVLDGLVRARME